MSKLVPVYVCTACGGIAAKWSGQCAECGEWNVLVEQVVSQKAAGTRKGFAGVSSVVQHIGDIATSEIQRCSTGDSEFDRVLGGGLVPGAVILIGGDPGIGKSTLLLQTMGYLSTFGPTLYVTGEESPQQVALSAQRLGLSQHRIALLAETDVHTIAQVAEKERPRVMVIDSIQTMHLSDLPMAPGGVSQVRESAAVLARLAKRLSITIFLVGHVTKSGEVAGPRVLEHIVDTVIYMEGQDDNRFRLLRSMKNRFGSIHELGVFAMTEGGLKSVSNPSAIFLSRPEQIVSGSVVMVIWEGTRPLLIEIQALVDETHMPTPRRITVGLDQNRLAMLLAVLHRHGGIFTYNQDVFVNVVGGVRVSETSADLALIAAIVSSLRNKPIPSDWVIFGEIGLSGEIRPVPGGQERLREAAKHGFTHAIVSQGNAPKKPIAGMKVQAVGKLNEALNLL